MRGGWEERLSSRPDSSSSTSGASLISETWRKAVLSSPPLDGELDETAAGDERHPRLEGVGVD
jgi:hypothetical protein